MKARMNFGGAPYSMEFFDMFGWGELICQGIPALSK